MRVPAKGDHHDYLWKESIIESVWVSNFSFKYDALALVYSSGYLRKKGRKEILKEKRIVGMLTRPSRSGNLDTGRYGRWLKRDSEVGDCCRDQRCGRRIRWSSNGDRFMSYNNVCGGGDDGKPSNAESQVRFVGKLHIFCPKDDVWVCPWCAD